MSQTSPFRAICGRWAVSWRVWLIVSLLTQVPTSILAAQVIDGSPPIFILPGIVGALGYGLVLFIADRTVLRNRREEPAPVALVLSVWLIAVVSRTFSAGIVFAILGAQITSEMVLQRLLVSFFGMFSWIWLTTYYFAVSDHYRTVVLELQASSKRLREIQHRMSVDQAELRETLTATIEQSVLPALRGLERELEGVSDASSQQQLLALAESAGGHSRELVREVSHRISVGDVGSASDQASSSPDELEPGQATREGWTISIGWAPLIFAASTFPIAVLNSQGSQLIRELVGYVPWLLVLCVMRFAQPVIRRWIRISSLAYVIIANLLAVLLGASIQLWAFGVTPDRQHLLGLPGLWITALLASAIAATMIRSLTLLQRDRARIESQNAEVAESTTRLDSSIALLRQQVAQILHGPVQGRLAAVALALRVYVDAQRAGEPVSFALTFGRCRTLLEQVNADIDAVLLDTLDHSDSIATRLSLLRERWTGLIDVEWTIAEGAGTLIDADPLNLRRVSGVVEEAINNACSHGRARMVTVSIGVLATTAVITVVDDGSGPPTGITPGLGMHDIEMAGGEWSLTSMGAGGARLAVRLPLVLVT